MSGRRAARARRQRGTTAARLLALAMALGLVVALAACGKTTVVREPALVARDDASARPNAAANAPSTDAIRIVVVTHGQASSPFWAIVRNGVAAAARQMSVLVSYRAPDVYSVKDMQAMVESAVASRPDGLVVSLPEPAVGPAVKRATEAGIPVVTINSGSDVATGLGVLAHVGQPEERAGLEAGRRMAATGARHVLCVNHQAGNQGLDDRCAGLRRAMREAGGRSDVIVVDDQSAATPRRLAEAIDAEGYDGVLTLNATTAIEALEALRSIDKAEDVPLGTFDLKPDVLAAVRDGHIRFAVDQQAYLQGYLPVILLTERARYGLFPEGKLIATGPHFVTKGSAEQAIELSKRSIR